MSITAYSFTGTKQTATPAVPTVGKLSEAAVGQALRAVTANQDRQRAVTKDRGAVRGGGRKPWKQKGTGRARAGSSRSPLWRGGGVTFGPDGSARPRQELPRKLKQAVRLWLLAQRAEHDTVVVLTGSAKLERTKEAAVLLAKVGVIKPALVVMTAEQLPAARGFRNLDQIELVSPADVSLTILARYGSVVASADAWQSLTTLPTKVTSPVKPAVPVKKSATPMKKASTAQPTKSTKPAVKIPAAKATAKRKAA